MTAMQSMADSMSSLRRGPLSTKMFAETVRLIHSHQGGK